MDKKYLMLIPLAVPLFFGGKAAVNALKKRTINTGNGGRYKEIHTIGGTSPDSAVIESDIHIDDMREAAYESELQNEMHNDDIKENPDEEIMPPSEKEISNPEEEEIPSSSLVNKDAEISDSGEQVSEKTILTGPKGGRYYIDDSGRKIYLKK